MWLRRALKKQLHLITNEFQSVIIMYNIGKQINELTREFITGFNSADKIQHIRAGSSD